MIRAALAASVLLVAPTAAFAQGCFPPASSTPQGRSCSNLNLGAAPNNCNLDFFLFGQATPVITAIALIGIQPLGIPLPSPPFGMLCFLDFVPLVTFGFQFPGFSVPLPTAPVPTGTTIYVAALLMHPTMTGPFWTSTNNMVLIW